MSMFYQIFLCAYISLVTGEKDLYENTVTTAASHFKNFEEVAKTNLTLPKSLPSSERLSKPSIRYGTHSMTIEIDNETVLIENYTYPKSSMHVVETPRLHNILTSHPSSENKKIFKTNGGYRQTIISGQGHVNTVVGSISTSGNKILSIVKTPHDTYYYRYENNTHIITSDPSSEKGTVISLPTEYDNKKTIKANGSYRETIVSGQGHINNVIGSVSTSGNKIVSVVKTPHGFNYRYENNTHIITSDPSSEKGKATFKGGGYRETIISGQGHIYNAIGSVSTSGNKIVSVVKTPHGTYYAYENDTHIITSDSEPSLENTAFILFQKSYIISIFVFLNYNIF